MTDPLWSGRFLVAEACGVLSKIDIVKEFVFGTAVKRRFYRLAHAPGMVEAVT